jgi:hypothetical protein
VQLSRAAGAASSTSGCRSRVFAAGQGAETTGDVAAVTGREPGSPDDSARAEFAAT